MTDARSDAPHVQRVKFEVMTAAAAEILGPRIAEIDPWARYAYKASALTAYLSAHEADAPRFEILSGRALAGAIAIRRNWLRGPYLQFLGILPAYQHQGIGRVALDWFESDARSGGAQNLWVAASDFNARALAFYEHHGFARVATLDDLVGQGHNEILLRKRLGAP